EWSRLELELHTQPQRRRELENSSGAVERIREAICRDVRHTRDTTVDGERLIQTNCALVVENVEPVNLETKFTLLTELDRVISVHVQIESGRSAVGSDAVDDIREARLCRSDGRHDGRTTRNAEAF